MKCKCESLVDDILDNNNVTLFAPNPKSHELQKNKQTCLT